MQQQHNNCKHLIPFPLLSNDVVLRTGARRPWSNSPSSYRRLSGLKTSATPLPLHSLQRRQPRRNLRRSNSRGDSNRAGRKSSRCPSQILRIPSIFRLKPSQPTARRLLAQPIQRHSCYRRSCGRRKRACQRRASTAGCRSRSLPEMQSRRFQRRYPDRRQALRSSRYRFLRG